MITFSHVSLRHSSQAQPVLTDVTLTIGEAEFVALIGRTGSGKTTFLNSINGVFPHLSGGELTGDIRVAGQSIAQTPPRDLAEIVGRVSQDPLTGFTTDNVEEEIAYGMEQLAVPPAVMRARVEEILDLLGIAHLRNRSLMSLSGGECQRVAIGAAIAAGPKILVLDEPTSALDPTAAEEVLSTLSRLVTDLGMTVVIAEHRLERVVQFVDSIVLLDNGKAIHGSPTQLLASSPVKPPIIELGLREGWNPLPLSVRDARRCASSLRDRLAGRTQTPDTRLTKHSVETAGLSVHYGSTPAVNDVTLSVNSGEVTAIMGRNGSGKTSLLWAIQGQGHRNGGRVHIALDDGLPTHDPAQMSAKEARKYIALVPQNPSDLLYEFSVEDECRRADEDADAQPGTCRALLDSLVPGIDPTTHPRDLSEGSKLALVLAIQTTAHPRILLLDEPTRGLDYPAKQRLASHLKALARNDQCVVLACHDVEFVALVADRVVLMAQGDIVADGDATSMLCGSAGFAPQVAKILAPLPITTVEGAYV